MLSKVPMIKYSLDMQMEPFLDQVNFDDKIALLGSCFTEHISKKLSGFHLDIYTNPNGIVFNPLSLAEPINRLINKQGYTEADLMFNNGLWVSLYHHGKFSSGNKAECLQMMNAELKKFGTYLQSADWLIITFGTAWVYEHIERKVVVANCHKVPQVQFKKRLLSIHEITECWQTAIQYLKEINPGLKIIYTISPVRHLRDGVHANNLSKSTLHLSILPMLSESGGIFYFPAYELVTDDLRDYRFFEPDGAHPNSMAIAYVFDKFRQCAFTGACNRIIDDIENYYKLRDHRPLDTSELNKQVLNTKLETMKLELIANTHRLEGQL